MTADIFTVCVLRKKSFISLPNVIKVVHADKFSERGGVYFVLILSSSFKFHNISVQQIKFDLASAAHTFADGT